MLRRKEYASRFTDEQITKLIQLRIKYDHKFQNTSNFKAAWAAIQKDSALQCINIRRLQLKWHYLARKYKEIITQQNTNDCPTEWQYFELMNSFFELTKGNNFPSIIKIESLKENDESMDYMNIKIKEETDFIPDSTGKSPPTEKDPPIKKRPTLHNAAYERTLDIKLKKEMLKAARGINMLLKSNFGINVDSDSDD